MCLKSTAASIFRKKCPFGTSISVHTISIVCHCSFSFFSIFIICSHYIKKTALHDLF